MTIRLAIPFYYQKTKYTCGPACVRMLAAFSGKHISEDMLAQRVLVTTTYGTSRQSMKRLLKSVGLFSYEVRHGTLKRICQHIDEGHPVIINYQEHQDEEDHYAIVVGYTDATLLLHDPAHDKYFSIPRRSFLRRWKNQSRRKKYTGWMLAVSQVPFPRS